jgi:hypothetical protein
MLYSTVTLVIVFSLALAGSYLITRPIGDRRRHIAATILSAALGTLGGFLIANMAVSVFAALAGAFLGMMAAWRRRNPLGKPQTQPTSRLQISRRSHYHGIGRA